MKSCKCGKDLIDFEEVKFGLCWTCMSQDDTLLENNPDLGKIQDIEDGNGNEKYSITIRNQKEDNITFEAKSKEKVASTVKKEDAPIVDGDGVDTKKATTEKGKKGDKPPVVDSNEGMKVVRESREVLTKIDRAKVRAFAIINQSIRETGVFNVVALVDGQSLSVSSEPYQEGDIENIKMTTTMEVNDAVETKKKK